MRSEIYDPARRIEIPKIGEVMWYDARDYKTILTATNNGTMGVSIVFLQRVCFLNNKKDLGGKIVVLLDKDLIEVRDGFQTTKEGREVLGYLNEAI